jgi:hypothetical protein
VAAAATDLGGGQSTSTADTSTTNRTPVHKLQHPQQPVASHQAQEVLPFSWVLIILKNSQIYVRILYRYNYKKGMNYRKLNIQTQYKQT